MQPRMTRTQMIEDAQSQFRRTPPMKILEIVADNMETAEECDFRIKEEGVVVRDLKGSVIPHPAIEIRHKCNKVVSDLILTWNKV